LQYILDKLLLNFDIIGILDDISNISDLDAFLINGLKKRIIMFKLINKYKKLNLSILVQSKYLKKNLFFLQF
jgi:hypothetical protein